MKSFKEYLTENVSSSELDDVEKLADRLFAKFKIDVSFTRHFKDRVNDARNNPSISAEELKGMFKKAFYGAGNRIAALGADAEAVLNDVQKELNLPFILKWDSKNNELELVSKTIMRKKDFKSPDRKIKI